MLCFGRGRSIPIYLGTEMTKYAIDSGFQLVIKSKGEANAFRNRHNQGRHAQARDPGSGMPGTPDRAGGDLEGFWEMLHEAMSHFLAWRYV